MVNKVVALERHRRGRGYAKGPHLPPNWTRTRQVHDAKSYHRPNKQSQFHNQQPRIKSRRRRLNYKILFLLVPTLISVILFRFLLSWLPSACVAPTTSENTTNTVLPSPALENATTPPVAAIGRAIVDKESKADLQALNPHSGALGLAQVMPDNLSEWSQDLLGYRLTPDEFLANPELQLQIVEYKLGEYWQEALADSSGDEELAVLKVASYWYSGDPDLYTSTTPQSYRGTNGELHQYPSVAEYSNSILKKYKEYRSG